MQMSSNETGSRMAVIRSLRTATVQVALELGYGGFVISSWV